MKASKSMIALAAAAVFGVAMAQGTPPNSAVTDPAVGAGQRSTQNTPMGTTGTPGGGGKLSSGATTTGSGTSMGAGSTASPTTTDTSANATADTGTHKATTKHKAKKSKKHKAQADRG